MLVSSARITVSPSNAELTISFIYNKKIKGPRTDPCGTPNIMFLESDLVICLQFSK